MTPRLLGDWADEHWTPVDAFFTLLFGGGLVALIVCLIVELTR